MELTKLARRYYQLIAKNPKTGKYHGCMRVDGVYYPDNEGFETETECIEHCNDKAIRHHGCHCEAIELNTL